MHHRSALRSEAINITDNASNSPQIVALNGVGVATKLDLSTRSMTFAPSMVGVKSDAKIVRSQPKHDYDVQVHGGVGGIDVHCLHKDGDRWVNETSRHGNSTIRVNVTGGIGHIQLIAD